MKSCNQIIFVVSCFMFSAVVAMQVVPTQREKWYIDVDKNSVEQLVGGAIRYYDEYGAREFHKKNIVSFLVECTDSLPIEYCGEKRFFVTSAIRAGLGQQGEALVILDPAIKQLAIVRGVVQSNNNRINIYLGLETDNVKLFDNIGKRIYPTKVMAIQIPEKSDYWSGYPGHGKCLVLNEVASFGIVQIMEEFKKKFPKVENHNVNDYRFQFLCKKLLGRCARDFDFETQKFNFQKCYWSKEKNK